MANTMPDSENQPAPQNATEFTQCSANEAAELLLLLGGEPAAGIIKHLNPREIRIVSEKTEKTEAQKSGRTVPASTTI